MGKSGRDGRASTVSEVGQTLGEEPGCGREEDATAEEEGSWGIGTF